MRRHWQQLLCRTRRQKYQLRNSGFCANLPFLATLYCLGYKLQQSAHSNAVNTAKYYYILPRYISVIASIIWIWCSCIVQIHWYHWYMHCSDSLISLIQNMMLFWFPIFCLVVRICCWHLLPLIVCRPFQRYCATTQLLRLGVIEGAPLGFKSFPRGLPWCIHSICNIALWIPLLRFNTRRPTQNGRYFADIICRSIFCRKCFFIRIFVQLDPRGPIESNPAAILQ